ncbi:RNA exonuclease 1 homolog [Heptranchias perlo]|uniref:RNA exonuclease 1 homolog n=1 Tax=Heptranchias perlo TaxID=212740 RepID=UPI00355A1ABB
MKYVYKHHKKTLLQNSLLRTLNSNELETSLPNPNHLYKSPDADDSTALAPNALEKQSDQPMLPETMCTVLELEKVSKAIEAVKTEVEQQQHKLLMYKSSLECENHNFVTPATSSEYSFASSSTSMVNFLASTKQNPTAVYECQAQDTPLNSVVYNPTPASSLSLSKLTFNALNEVNEEDTFQYIPMASSKIKNACSVLNKYVIDRCRPCTDLEYDPLVNYSSNLKQNVKKEYVEEKQEFKRMIERSPEKKHTVASKTVRDCQPIKAEISSDDELVIDVPDLPPLTQNPRVHRRFQKKGNYANTSNLSLIRKVRQPRTTDSTNATLDVGKSLDDSVATNLQSENSSRGNEPNSGALQRKPKPDSSESCKSSNLTNGQTNKASRAYDVPKHGFKAKGIDMENSTAHVNANNVKLSNQKYRKEHVPAKLEVDVQKCEETKEQSLIHLDSFKRSNEKGPQARLESRNESLKVDKCLISTAMKCNVPGTANESKCINNVATGMRSDQQGQKMQKQADHFGNENWDESLQTTREKGEESSLSDEELNSTDSEDLDFSESDPMEECLRIFNESSKQASETCTEQKQKDTSGKYRGENQAAEDINLGT